MIVVRFQIWLESKMKICYVEKSSNGTESHEAVGKWLIKHRITNYSVSSQTGSIRKYVIHASVNSDWTVPTSWYWALPDLGNLTIY